MLLHHHLRGAVVLVLQVVTQHAEIWLRPPARLHLAASGQAVALAAQVHVIEDCLRNTRNIVRKFNTSSYMNQNLSNAPNDRLHLTNI